MSARPRPPLLTGAVTAAAFALLYVPLVAMVVYSFFDPLQKTWTLKWYALALGNQAVLESLRLSVGVALFATAVTTVLGTAAALALARGKFRGKDLFDAVAHIPLITPDIVIGLSLLVWFVLLGV